MARTPHDAVAALLRRTPLPKALRADAWDAFHGSATPDELTPKLQKLPLPKIVRASLWDLKKKHADRKDSQVLPRESKYGLGGQTMPAKEPKTDKATGAVSAFIAEHFRHFTAATLHDAAEAYKKFVAKDGKILLSIAGAASTGELGRSIAPMIRAGKIHAISCTSASLEESLFNLIAHDDYERIPDYYYNQPADDAALAKRNMNRVTDVALPEKAAMTPVETAVKKRLDHAKANGERFFPHEMMYDIINSKELESHYQDDPANCWLVAACEKNLPIVVPGFEDGTIANVIAAECLEGTYDPHIVKHGIESMVMLAEWYQDVSHAHDCGYVQLGGGIAGDFAICVVPMLLVDAGIQATKKWQLFIQFSSGSPDAYGGYSEARPVEKISWSKLEQDTPTFDIQGDFSINWPLLASVVMGW